MIRFLFLIRVAVTSPVNVRVPLSTNPLGWHLANISVPSVGRFNVSALVGLGERTIISQSNVSEPGWYDREIQILVPNHTFNYTGRVYLSPGRRSSLIDIGPSSVLTRSVGSVAILKGSAPGAELVVGSTSEYFNSSCIEGSFIRIPIAHNVPVDVDFDTGERWQYNAIAFRGNIPDLQIPFPEVPYSVFSRIRQSILALGGLMDRYGLTPRMNNCTSNIEAQLPEFRITFRPGHTVFGSLALFPEDYVSFDNDGSCLILVRPLDFWPQNDSPRVINFNPLALSQTNVRIVGNYGVELCDSDL